MVFFFSSRRRHTRFDCDWSSDVCSSDLLPGLGGAELDGLLFANSLHFVADPATALGALVVRVRTGGRIVIVEYDRRATSRWVPYPIPANRLPALAKAVGLTQPTIVASRASSFGGILYVVTGSRLS